MRSTRDERCCGLVFGTDACGADGVEERGEGETRTAKGSDIGLELGGGWAFWWSWERGVGAGVGGLDGGLEGAKAENAL